MVSLLRQILQNNPQIQTLNMYSFSYNQNDNAGELVLETLLDSSLDTIIDLNLGDNETWFRHPETKEERSTNVELLTELISRQTRL